MTALPVHGEGAAAPHSGKGRGQSAAEVTASRLLSAREGPDRTRVF